MVGFRSQVSWQELGSIATTSTLYMKEEVGSGLNGRREYSSVRYSLYLLIQRPAHLLKYVLDRIDAQIIIQPESSLHLITIWGDSS